MGTIHDDLVANDTATYWPIGSTSRDGTLVPGTPQNIQCRWLDKQEEFVDEEGQKQISSAKVRTNIEIKTGLLARGSDQTTPTLKIAKFSAVPNYDNTATLYVLHLMPSGK